MLYEDKLLSKKKSDSIVILGSGYSINDITDWSGIGSVDSIGFNWFCKHKFAPTFFIVREQANISNRVAPDENSRIFISSLNSEAYKNTLIVILDISRHSPSAKQYYPENFTSESIVLRDRKKSKSCNVLYCQKDIFNWGLFHGKCTLVSVMHLVLFLNYKHIYFAGVDLNDSRYFWLGKNKTRHTIKRKNKHYKNVHPIAKYVLKFLSRVRQKYPNILMCTMNKKSLLRKVMPYKSL